MSKFTTVDLAPYFNIERIPQGWHNEIGTDLKNLPADEKVFWGIPFVFGPQQGMSWIAVDQKNPIKKIPLSTKANFLIFAHFCDESHDPEGKLQPIDYNPGEITRPGEHLADYTLVYADGTEYSQAIRRRFEIGEILVLWGQWAFAARPHIEDEIRDWRGPYDVDEWGGQWGWRQTAVRAVPGRNVQYWLYALQNPNLEQEIKALRVTSASEGRVAIAGITLFHLKEHPLQHRRLETFQITLPKPILPEELNCSIDLGLIGRRFSVPPFNPEKWLLNQVIGWGDAPTKDAATTQVLIDVLANSNSTLKVADQKVNLKPIFDGKPFQSEDGQVRVEILTPRKAWIHAKVINQETNQPTPVRIHFRSKDGRYFPPYGHRHEVNDNWFENYGGDLKLGSTQYAYVDGDFQIELPVGDVYVEVAKGFEFMPIRENLTIHPGQKELILTINRPINMRKQGWVTADTHVHFLSPQTAWLEAQGEGLNLVNLLASQWGDLFTNVADITGDLSRVSHDDTLVWVGTENRQHMMGHMSLLGVKGKPIFPMCAGGPDESYLGDPVWSSLAEWADRTHEREGLVVIPHFPNPFCEVTADVVLGKVDGLEIRFFTPELESSDVREWYRYLNCGYRIAAVGGTDKMSAGQALGGVRTYAHLGDDELSFTNWAKAVRAGRTFTSSGPLIYLTVDGHAVGDEIYMKNGGTLELEARANCLQPFHELQIVMNGKVIASEVAEGGEREIRLREKLQISSSTWVAARCVSRYEVWQSITSPQPIHIGAHTSPVYIRFKDDDLFNELDATYMLTMIEGGLTWLNTLSIPASSDQHHRIQKVYKDAQFSLEQRMKVHKH